MSQSSVVLAGRDLPFLTSLAFNLGASYMVHCNAPTERLQQRPLDPGSAGVVVLNGTENVGDLQAMFKANASVPFVLLSPDFPPHAAVAKVTREHGSVVLPLSESPVVIAATLVTLLSRHGSLAV